MTSQQEPGGDHDPAAFAAEVARRVRSAVVSELPQRRWLRILTLVAVLGLFASGLVVLLGH